MLIGLVATAAILLVLVFLLGLHLYPAWIISFSVTTIALFGIDKGLAKAGSDRIPENVLHLFTVLGGFPGQLLGRILFHHKTNFSKHPSFNIVLVASTILWVIIGYFTL